MPDMDSMTEATGIDVEVMVTEVPGQSVSMMESGEEVEVHKLPAALAPKPVAWNRLLWERKGGAGVRPGE
jgi:hypothetical protein